MSRPILAFTLLLPVLALQVRPVGAQQQPTPSQDTVRRALQQLPPMAAQMSQAEILERIRQSGMTRGQARQRLAQAGYDAGLADRYFDVLERGGDPGSGGADPAFVQALQDIGVTMPGMDLPLDAAAAETYLRPVLNTPPAQPTGPVVFGTEFFRRDPWATEIPETFGPVDRDYRLGPGDELFLVLTGDVELAYTLNVTREGFVIIPDVGQVSVNGMTVGQLEDRLYARLGSVYSGVRRETGATTQFQVSLGRLRSNQIFVVGDVMLPGAKQISSAGRVLNALHAAGGPTDRGSFRRIEVRRGAELVGTFDMYEYLLRGDASNDIRLEHGDRIVVPSVGPQVRIEGVVRRPAIYEIKPGSDGLGDVLAFAGGLQPDAVVRRVQIERILPPAERTAGRYRALRDADLGALLNGAFIPVHDGDIVYVHAIPDVIRDRVWITGAVNNPGVFEWSRATTLSNLLERADGFADPAYTPRLQIYRLDPATGERSMLHAAVGNGIDPLLSDGDSVVVLSREDLRNPSFVSIDGFVKQPGEYGYAEGMTLRDLVLAAGGFIPGANIAEAEVSRLTNPFARSDTTALVYRIALDADTTELGYLGAPDWTPDLPDIVLQRGDRVHIRRAPGFEPLGQVAVTGEVLYPGSYTLAHRQERVVDMLVRAGWLTDESYVGGIRVTRRGTIVAADMERALRDPSHRSNIRLEPGDEIHVAAFDPTVTVTGAVTFSSRVLYRPGRDLSYYLDQAGGTTEVADKDRITVSYANGERARVREVLWFDRMPSVQPGSTIFVPEKPEHERGAFDLDRFLSRTLTVLGTLATILVAVDRL